MSKNVRIVILVTLSLLIVLVIGNHFRNHNPLGLDNVDLNYARSQVCDDLQDQYYELVVAKVASDYDVGYDEAAGFVNDTQTMCGGF